jgi:hypothetical protein
VGEVSCPTKYFAEASSINLRRSIVYGLSVLRTTMQFALQKWGMAHYPLFSSDGRKLTTTAENYYMRPASSAAAKTCER